MKKYTKTWLLTAFIAAITIPATAQDSIEGNFPYYYYRLPEYGPHDDAPNCYLYGRDGFFQMTESGNVTACFFDFIYDATKPKIEVAIQICPDTTLEVIGIALPDPSLGMTQTYNGGLYEDSINYAPSYLFYNSNGGFRDNIQMNLGRELVTVHYNVYDKYMTLIYTQSRNLADTATSRYIPFGYLHRGEALRLYPENFFPQYLPVNDFYFDTTLILPDTFYISRTMTFEDDTTRIISPCYMLFEFHPYGGNTRLLPWEKRLFRDTLLTGTWEEENFGWHTTGLFPIIRRDGDTCPQVRNVELFKSSPTQFFLRWQRGVNHHDWQVSLCPDGTDPADGTLFSCSDPITQLITVDPDSHYTAYVRARCRFARDEWGPWSNPVSVWLNEPTEAIGDSPAAPAVTLSPNPAHGSVQIVLPPSALGGRLALCDMTGRELSARTATSTTIDWDITTLAAGAYIIRLTTPQGSTQTIRLMVE